MLHAEIDYEKIEKNVQRSLKEEIERTEKRLHLIPTRPRSKEVSNKPFFDALELSINELQEGFRFLKEAESNPKLFFTDAYKYLRSTRGMVYTVMNYWKNPKERIKIHDFQIYLASLLNTHFNTWLKEKGIQGNFTIEVRNPNYFPSLFGVFHEETELIQFNILEKFYGIRKRPETNDEILKQHEKRLEQLDKEIKNQEERLKKAIDTRDHPLKHYKGIKNFFIYLFINKKKLRDAFDNLVKKEESLLVRFKVDKEREVYYLPKNLKLNEEKAILIEKVEPFFKELQYTLETKENKLY